MELSEMMKLPLKVLAALGHQEVEMGGGIIFCPNDWMTAARQSEPISRRLCLKKVRSIFGMVKTT